MPLFTRAARKIERMPLVRRASLAALAVALGVVGTAASLPALACGSFTESDPSVDAGGGPSASGDGGVPETSVDGSGAGAEAGMPSPEVCTELATDAGGYTDTSNAAMAMKRPEGLIVQYPSGSALTSASWHRSIVVPPGITGARMSVDATINLANVFSTSPPGYAGFVIFSNGDLGAIDRAPAVVLAHGAFDMTQVTFDLDLFPHGLGGGPSPEPMPASFSRLQGGSRDVHVTFDVTWSTMNATNAMAQLGDGGIAALVAPTQLAPSSATTWTLHLGGSAKDNAAVSISYERVCITLH
ncbi:MAG: hypothetical protein QOI41_6506 [Myxococcales bacterium]|nr:hypothetical protein [Myxococcales bacterium]